VFITFYVKKIAKIFMYSFVTIDTCFHVFVPSIFNRCLEVFQLEALSCYLNPNLLDNYIFCYQFVTLML
jgi:hypothetical protein